MNNLCKSMAFYLIVSHLAAFGVQFSLKLIISAQRRSSPGQIGGESKGLTTDQDELLSDRSLVILYYMNNVVPIQSESESRDRKLDG